jgi:hypothetical protein
MFGLVARSPDAHGREFTYEMGAAAFQPFPSAFLLLWQSKER